MLELKHITKVYEAGTTQVEALKGLLWEVLSLLYSDTRSSLRIFRGKSFP